MQSFTSNIIWECPECGFANDQEVEVPDLNYSAEKTSDMGVDDMTEIICEGCDLEFFGHVFVNVGGTDFEIEEPHKFSISGDMPMYGPDPDDEYYNPPDDPYSIAHEALGQLKAMVGTQGPANDVQFVNRLVFAGAISVLEAYLGDTLINAVQNDEGVRTELLKNYTALGDENFSAAELSSDPEAINKRIVSKLRDVLFHNLKVANNLYKAAFAISLAPEKEVRDILFHAMQKRHDCVHRNGRQKGGEKLTDFTDEYLHAAIDAIVGVVSHVENERLKDLPF